MELAAYRDAEADRLMKKYVPLLTSIVTAILDRYASRENVEECVYAVIWEYLRSDSYDAARGSEKTYLCVLARSRAMTLAKSLAAQSTLPLEDAAYFLSAPDAMEAAELRMILLEALDTLKTRDRRLFTLRYLYQLSTREIAHQLGESQTAVTTRLSRLRKRLAETLSAQGIHLE